MGRVSRALSWDGTDVEIGSRGAKPLTRYFPELVAACTALLPEPCLLDGEIVVALAGSDGRRRLSWEALSQRIHPAASRVALLSRETPAMFIAFDLRPRRARSPAGAVLDAPRRTRRPPADGPRPGARDAHDG
jgi:ATP-dependent DNA ligase